MDWLGKRGGCRAKESAAREELDSADDDDAVYCSLSETNSVYLWEGYVLHTERCDKISGLSPSRGLCLDLHLSEPRMC